MPALRSAKGAPDVYLHSAHAGNFADVFKHALLGLLLAQRVRSSDSLCYVDVHAGAGRYPARRSASLFMAALVEHCSAFDALVPLVRAVRTANRPAVSGSRGSRRYPGSPLVAATVLRPGDRLILVDRGRRETASLRRLFAADRRVRLYRGDGLSVLRRLRPVQRQGVIFLDPPLLDGVEIRDAVRGLQLAARLGRRFTGVLWYPLRRDGTQEALYDLLSRTGLRGALALELPLPENPSGWGLSGCGMLFVHTPPRFALAAKGVLPTLTSLLTEGRGRFRVLAFV
jgi:23S rRNA (adenine2030-N6)-methyltransferase